MQSSQGQSQRVYATTRHADASPPNQANEPAIHAALIQLRRGDLAGLEPLVTRYQVEAVRAAFLITRDRASAEDVVQTVFVRLAERIHQYDPVRPFAPYLFRSVINEAIKTAKRQQKTAPLDDEVSEDVTLADLLPDPAPTPDIQIERDEIRRLVWEAMEQLPPKQRAVAVLRYYLGWSEAELAEHFDVPAGTIKWRLHDARERLRKLLTPHMGALVLLVLARL